MFTLIKYIKSNMLNFMYFINVNVLGSQDPEPTDAVYMLGFQYAYIDKIHKI